MEMAGTGEHDGGASVRWRDRLLPLVVILVSAAIAVVLGSDVVDRVRSDTPVSAITVGEPGCVTAARFIDPEGTSHLVSLRVYKSNCVGRDPGEPVTVYYDADDPSTNAATRSWWWPGLLMVLPLGMMALGVRALVRGPAAPAPARTRAPASLTVPRRRPARTSPPPPERFLVGDDADAPYRWDYALGRTEVLLDHVRAEMVLPAADRASGASDGLLGAIHHHLEAMLRCLNGSAMTPAEEHGRAVSRLVSDQMSYDSQLANDLLGLVRKLFG